MNELNPVHNNIMTAFKGALSGAMSQQKAAPPNYWRELELTVAYDYEPYEPPNYDVESMTCGPGGDASVTINSIEFRGLDIMQQFTEKEIEDMEQEILESLES